MKRVVVHGKKRVFDGFFKIDEAEVSFERFDGRMSPRLRRLCFERGDSVAVVIYDRDARRGSEEELAACRAVLDNSPMVKAR